MPSKQLLHTLPTWPSASHQRSLPGGDCPPLPVGPETSNVMRLLISEAVIRHSGVHKRLSAGNWPSSGFLNVFHPRVHFTQTVPSYISQKRNLIIQWYFLRKRLPPKKMKHSKLSFLPRSNLLSFLKLTAARGIIHFLIPHIRSSN